MDRARQMEEEGQKIIRLNIGNLAVFGFDAPGHRRHSVRNCSHPLITYGLPTPDSYPYGYGVFWPNFRKQPDGNFAVAEPKTGAIFLCNDDATFKYI